MEKEEIRQILDNTLCFTHGGTLGGLYGILATHKISSHNALISYGDSPAKFTDPDKSFNQEDNFLFFESMADRGNLAYSSLIERNENHAGFAFLLVASADTLLKQVDMIGSSDGILLGRQDLKALDIDISQLDAKILVPESYRDEVTKFCTQLKELGHTPPEHLLMFKPMNELNDLLKITSHIPEQSLIRQKEFCEAIGLKANIASQIFDASEKIINTKTSTITVAVSENKLNNLSDPQIFSNGKDLLAHMKKRPTLANLQRNSMLLFGEKNNTPLSKNVANWGNLPVLDIASNHQDLAFSLNTLAQLHPFKEDVSGEKRISSYETRSISARLQKSSNETGLINGICECLEVVRHKNISTQECSEIMQKHLNPQWFIAINRVQQPPIEQLKIKQLVDLNLDKEIMVWKQGMKDWANIKDVPELNLSKASLNIAEMRKKAFPSVATGVELKS